MKKIVIALILVAFILVGCLSYKNLNEKTITIKNSQQDDQKPLCSTFPNYMVITKRFEEQVGETIIVRKISSTPTTKSECAFEERKDDFILKNPGEYYKTILNNKLITDSGSSHIRDITVYDLESRKQIYKDTYIRDMDFKNDNGTFWSVTYWKVLDEIEKPTIETCPELKNPDWYGSAGFEKLVSLDLSDMTVKDLGQKECSYRE